MSLRVKELRRQAGLTQQQLADMAGLERSQLSKVENEKEHVNTRRLAAIAKALKVPVSDLFEDGSTRDAQQNAILSVFESLPPDARAQVLAHARALAVMQQSEDQ